jgi:hypothetical protein
MKLHLTHALICVAALSLGACDKKSAPESTNPDTATSDQESGDAGADVCARSLELMEAGRPDDVPALTEEESNMAMSDCKTKMTEMEASLGEEGFAEFVSCSMAASDMATMQGCAGAPPAAE